MERVSRMKFLVISNCPLLYHQGSGYVILNVAKGLEALGHEVETYGPDDFEPWEKVRYARSYKVALGMLLFTFRKVMRTKYDIVIFYGGEAWLALQLLYRIPNRKFLIVSNSNGLETRYMDVMESFFGDFSYNNKPRRWYQLDQRKLYEKAFFLSDGIVTNNEEDRLYGIEKQYKDEQHIVSVDLGIGEAFLGITPDFSNTRTLGFCGSWIKRKGTDAIGKDISRVLKENSDYKLILIGAGKEFTKESFFDSDVCNQIIVHAEVKSKKVLIQIYKSISIFILPSFYESFGLVMAEAMACGCALVATNTGFASGLSDHEAVIMEEPYSPSLYYAVKKLILNEGLRKKIAVNGYKRVQSLKWKESVLRMERTYQKWLADFRK